MRKWFPVCGNARFKQNEVKSYKIQDGLKNAKFQWLLGNVFYHMMCINLACVILSALISEETIGTQQAEKATHACPQSLIPNLTT